MVTTREGPEKFPVSRKKSLAFIAVDALSEDDAARLIEDHQIETDGQWSAATAEADSAAACEIARELGGFTLAVESVAIFLGLYTEIRPADYLNRLRAEGLIGVDALPGEADVAAQMQHREKQLHLVLDQTLDRLTSPERTALDYAALLPPEQIPWPWLRELVALEHPDALRAKPGFPDPWLALHRRLEGLRLLTPGDHVEIARLHRMVGSHLRLRLSVTGRKSRILSIVSARSVNGLSRDSSSYWELRAIAAFGNTLVSVRSEELDAVHKIASYLFHYAYYQSAENLYLLALGAIEAHKDTPPECAADIHNGYGMLLNATDRLQNAEVHLKKAISIYDRYVPDKPILQFPALNNLAIVYKNTDRYEQAEAAFLKILNSPNTEGDHHEFESSLRELANSGYANLLADLGRYSEAEPLMRTILQRAEEEKGHESGEVATSLINLGQVCHHTGRIREALEMFERAFAILEASLPSDHPNLALAANNVASMLHTEGRFDEAEKKYRWALEVHERRNEPGFAHGEVLINLSLCLQSLERNEEAEKLASKAVEMFERTFGDEDTRVAVALNALGEAILCQGRSADAQPIYRRALAIFGTQYRTTGRVLAQLHPALRNYAGILIRSGVDPLQLMHQLQQLTHFSQARITRLLMG